MCHCFCLLYNNEVSQNVWYIYIHVGSDFDGTIKYEAENVIGSDEMNMCTGSDFVCTPENEEGSDDAIASAEKNIAWSFKTMAITK